eukprot:m.198650 g.198650  ORF g.198650 m.198650 type:complete len:79 (-) comp53791_c2_seq3:252-488(-)
MNNNQLTAVANGSFSALINLSDLHLDENRLTSINSDMLNNLTRLMFLRLNHNLLTAIPSVAVLDLHVVWLHASRRSVT